MSAANQLLAYRFEADSSFDGQLVGALERIESGGTIRILDALFVGRLAETGELVAVSTDGSADMTGRLLGFRLDAAQRDAATRRALEGASGGLVQALGEQLSPGSAIAAVLIEHTWSRTLQDAVTRSSGSEMANAFVDAAHITEIQPPIHARIGQRTQPTP